MPDAHGNFKSISVPADAWERIFGRKSAEIEGLRNIVESDLQALRARIEARKANRDKRPTDK